MKRTRRAALIEDPDEVADIYAAWLERYGIEAHEDRAADLANGSGTTRRFAAREGQGRSARRSDSALLVAGDAYETAAWRQAMTPKRPSRRKPLLAAKPTAFARLTPG